MCVVSMIGDFYSEKFQPYFNWPQTSQTEFDALKKDVLEMKELLRRAKIYDEKNNQKDCELEEKFKLLKEIAKMVGVELTNIKE